MKHFHFIQRTKIKIITRNYSYIYSYNIITNILALPQWRLLIRENGKASQQWLHFFHDMAVELAYSIDIVIAV